MTTTKTLSPKKVTQWNLFKAKKKKKKRSETSLSKPTKNDDKDNMADEDLSAEGSCQQQQKKSKKKNYADYQYDQNPVSIGNVMMTNSAYGSLVEARKRVSSLPDIKDIAPLPTIIVIGSESAGKSSTLERIAGFELFPRDSKICTRMPVKLSMIHDENITECQSVTIKYPGRPDNVVSEEEAVRAIASIMDAIATGQGGIVNEVLTVEVRSNAVPTLDLVDLPGIVAASIEGEPADMMQRTRSLTESYLRQENTIVVVVVPANTTRVRDSQAMQLVQQYKKEDVAIGVLAKADLAYDPRYAQRKKQSPRWELEERLQGQANDLPDLHNGYVAVKNRDSLVEEEEAGSLIQSTQAEAEWFANETRLTLEQSGITALVSKINEQIESYVKQPGGWKAQAMAHIKERKFIVDASLTALGPPPCSLTIERVVDEFVECFQTKSSFFDAIESDITRASSPELCCHQTSDYPAGCLSIIQRIKFKQNCHDDYIRLLDDICLETKESVKKELTTLLKACDSDFRLCRFENFHDVVIDAALATINSGSIKFKACAKDFIKNFFVNNLTGIAISGTKESAALRLLGTYKLNCLQAAVAEIAVCYLVMPFSENSKDVIMNYIHMSAQKFTESSKKRKRSQPSSSSPLVSSSSSLCLSSDINESELLQENCAEQRSHLAKMKQDLFIASSDVEGL